MGISSKVQRKLWGTSGGYCCNPTCHAELLAFLESGDVGNIEEMAHIIGQKENGPRGDDELPLSERDEFENIILLCPTCHTIIDKNPNIYSKELLKKWKREHEDRIKNLFITPKFNTRQELRSYIAPFLEENHEIFNMFGPRSENAVLYQQSTEYEWERQCIHKLIPNNRKIEYALSSNRDLLTCEEQHVLIRFKIHREGFEYNHVSGNVSEVVPLFPSELNKICL